MALDRHQSSAQCAGRDARDVVDELLWTYSYGIVPKSKNGKSLSGQMVRNGLKTALKVILGRIFVKIFSS